MCCGETVRIRPNITRCHVRPYLGARYAAWFIGGKCVLGPASVIKVAASIARTDVLSAFIRNYGGEREKRLRR